VTSDLGTGPIYRSLAAEVEKFKEELLILAGTGGLNAKIYKYIFYEEGVFLLT